MNTYTVVYVDNEANLFVDEGIKDIYEFAGHLKANGYKFISVQITS